MSKQQFVVFAERIARIENAKERARTAKLVADVCAQFGRLFDRAQFYKAHNVAVSLADL